MDSIYGPAAREATVGCSLLTSYPIVVRPVLHSLTMQDHNYTLEKNSEKDPAILTTVIFL